MLVKLKSNGTEHEIKKEIWDKMPLNSQRNYTILNKADVKVAENTVDNTSKKTTSVDNTTKEKAKEPEKN